MKRNVINWFPLKPREEDHVRFGKAFVHSQTWRNVAGNLIGNWVTVWSEALGFKLVPPDQGKGKSDK